MKGKRVIALSAAAAMFAGMTLNASAARTSVDRYVDRLRAKDQIGYILDLEAYRAAYSDLDEAFGDDWDAYVEHYLTAGVYEGRTKGVLFDPLAYAEGYDDIREAFGEDVLAIVSHYVSCGVKENRTIGTAAGCEDIAAAVESGVVRRTGLGEVRQSSSAAATGQDTVGRNTAGQAAGSQVAGQAAGGQDTADQDTGSQGAGQAAGGQDTADQDTGSQGAGQDTADQDTGSQGAGQAAAGQAAGSQDTAGQDTGSQGAGQDTAGQAAGSQDTAGQIPGSQGAGQTPETSGTQTADSSTDISYWRTTSIYADDNVTLLRVEYYDENNKLIYYSVVKDFDSSTNSYTEDIYSKDMELVGTDTYVNGTKTGR